MSDAEINELADSQFGDPSQLTGRVCLLGRATIATGSWLGRVAVVVELYVSVVGCCRTGWHVLFRGI